MPGHRPVVAARVRVAVEQAIELSLLHAFRVVSYVCAGSSWFVAFLTACMLPVTAMECRPCELIEVDVKAASRRLIIEKELTSLRHRGDATRNQPDSCWTAVAESEQRSSCSLWWRNTPQIGNERVGIIGHYAADGEETSQALLARACETLRATAATWRWGPWTRILGAITALLPSSAANRSSGWNPPIRPNGHSNSPHSNFRPLAGVPSLHSTNTWITKNVG